VGKLPATVDASAPNTAATAAARRNPSRRRRNDGTGDPGTDTPLSVGIRRLTPPFDKLRAHFTHRLSRGDRRETHESFRPLREQMFVDRTEQFVGFGMSQPDVNRDWWRPREILVSRVCGWYVRRVMLSPG
jgi:hypothetical protein